MPGNLKEEMEARRAELVERISEVDDEVADLFLAEKPIEAAVLKAAVRRWEGQRVEQGGTAQGWPSRRRLPVQCGRAQLGPEGASDLAGAQCLTCRLICLELFTKMVYGSSVLPLADPPLSYTPCAAQGHAGTQVPARLHGQRLQEQG